MPQMRQGDIGSTIRIRLLENGAALNVATASVKNLKLKKPDGTVVTKSMAFETSGADGVVVYTTVLDDLDQVGPWVGQVYIEMPSGKWHSDQFSFNVGNVLI